jgi:hypothetical protein
MSSPSSASRPTSTGPTSTPSSAKRYSTSLTLLLVARILQLIERGGGYKAWDAFYILATELAHKAKGFEFETYVNNFMRDVVFPSFNGYLNSCQEPRTKLTTKRECIKRIVSFDLNITLGPDISYVTSLLPSVVKYVMSAIVTINSIKANMAPFSKERVAEHKKGP